MKTLYIDCQMGVAGDMLMAALLDISDDKDGFSEKMNLLGIPGLGLSYGSVVREGYEGTLVQAAVNEHDYVDGRTLSEVHKIIDELNVSASVKTHAKGVYRIIAEAEAMVHGTDMEHVHFHEVGALSAIADITGVCMLMEQLNPEKIIVSPIHVGSGTVRCAHGVLPVPAPATAKILENMPIYSGEVNGELCTPTGAALLRYFSDGFGPCPTMTIQKEGRGMGTKIFPGMTNGLAVMLGEISEM